MRPPLINDIRCMLAIFIIVENLGGYKGNIAVLLAEQDEVIPVRHGQRLFESISTRKKLWLFKGARHNEMPIAAEQPWWGEVTGFVSQ